MVLDADTRAATAGITDADDAATRGLYGPGSEAWRLNREAMLLLGAGPRSLLLQVAHPLIAEGVDQHSTFREDPWSRLAATTTSYLRIVYGSGASARDEIRRLNTLHRGITGPVRDESAQSRHGPTYTARDPELSLWVHATLIESVLVAWDAWIEPLRQARRARFYRETKPIGRAFGIPDSLLPADLDGFERYMATMLSPDGPVRPNHLSRELARAILHPKLGPAVRAPAFARPLGRFARPIERALDLVPSPLYDWTLLPAVGLLPPAIRDAYGLPWRALERTVATWLLRTWQLWRPRVPASVRAFPTALAAERRVAVSTTTGSGGGTSA